MTTPLQKAAYDIGAKGSEPTEEERLAFESWMRGHCWAVIGEWDGKQYKHAHESTGFVHGGAMETRRLWAAWRDRGAVARVLAEQAQAVEPVAVRHSYDGYGWMYDDSGSGSNWLESAMQYVDAEPVFTHPAPPPAGERAELIAFLREITTTLQPAHHIKQKANASADMLEADAQPKQVTCQIYGHVVGACVECNTHIEAQQVAVPTTVATLKRYEPELYDEDRVRMELDSNGDWVKYSDFLAQQVAVPYDQQALELCPACGWKAVIPGEPCLNCGRGEVMKALDAYAAERDALMADAARYQFMKSCSRVAGLDIGGWHSWTCQIMRSDIKGATLDEAIDAAIKKAGIETKTDWSAA